MLNPYGVQRLYDLGLEELEHPFGEQGGLVDFRFPRHRSTSSFGWCREITAGWDDWFCGDATEAVGHPPEESPARRPNSGRARKATPGDGETRGQRLSSTPLGSGTVLMRINWPCKEAEP